LLKKRVLLGGNRKKRRQGVAGRTGSGDRDGASGENVKHSHDDEAEEKGRNLGAEKGKAQSKREDRGSLRAMRKNRINREQYESMGGGKEDIDFLATLEEG